MTVIFKKPHLSLTKEKHEINDSLISQGSIIHLWECCKERQNEEKVLQNFWITSPYGSQILGIGWKTPMKSKHSPIKRQWFPTVAFQSQARQGGETAMDVPVKDLGNRGKWSFPCLFSP